MLFGTGSIDTIAKRAPRVRSLDTDPLTLTGIELLRVTFEIERRDVESFFPPALQATLPPLVIWSVLRCKEGPLGPFCLADTQLSCRSGARSCCGQDRALLPPEAAAEPWFSGRAQLERERLRLVESVFAPLPVLALGLQDDEATGLARLSALGGELFRDVEPDAVLSAPERVRFERAGEGYSVVFPLPNADPEQLAVAKVEDELTVRVGSKRRALVLPRRLARLDLAGARLVDGELRVALRRTNGSGEGAAR